MGCIVEFNNTIRFEFIQNIENQKVWIEALLRFRKANMDYLAHLLNLPTELITQVHQGTHYLEKEPAERLGQLFLITFGT